MSGLYHLPPKPDIDTGEPRPPRAPVESGTKELEKSNWVPRNMPKVPDGRGRILEWYAAPRKYQVYTAATFVVLGILVYTLRSWSFEWVGTWWLWVILAGLAGLGYLIPVGHRMAAGADWFCDNRAWVSTYELVRVEVSGYAGG